MTAPNTTRRWTTRRILCFAAQIAIVIVALLLYRGCVPKPGPEPTPTAKEALFVPADLARLKGLDRDGVLEYCRTQIKPANYEGILRGAHGALWAGEANAWNRRASRRGLLGRLAQVVSFWRSSLDRTSAGLGAAYNLVRLRKLAPAG